MHTNDLPLTKEDIGQLENADQIIHFFAKLGYDADDAIPLDHAALGMDTEDLRQQIHRIHRVASDPDEDLIIYHFQVRSVTVALTQTIARRFRERTEEALLVLTREYESLDFVLLDREIEKGTQRGKAFKQIIRPRSLTVNRRNPDPVSLRVLKRFTFTEEDGIYQWEKLRAAYAVAEWAEPEFNNRALFSDYYLKNRLADKKLTPAWADDVRPIGRQVHQHLSQARQKYTQQPEKIIRSRFFEPLFKELGFEFEIHKSGSSSAEEPDYKLYTPGDREKPVALALTYVWNRSLDDKDPVRDRETADEIPGAQVVSVLENTDVSWVIMTNGKLWRLYSATASNKATNYYEIDLEEALAAEDQLTPLKYWWLLFRHDAYTGFLDKLLKDSNDYAQDLGDRLKDRVFTEIFPHFAAGFIHNMRAKSGQSKAIYSDETLQLVYEGTLSFLYRLMFVLYAESLELLPLYEKRGYRELSLYKMKREIAANAGDILDETPDKLKKSYTAIGTEMYDRLTKLFKVIDTGSDALNLPTYNGGLFSRTNDAGQFLSDYAIPDRHLAQGLDRLCRDVDDKTQALALIDFKSLGVRHLGSIYEGLLEFKLRIATEKLAVIKEKGKEVYILLAKAGKKRVKDTVEKGAVYLENDKQERKATGSYYTPDYIVKYIVENTVGPVLERKFEALTPRLREAQKQYRRHKKKVAARGGDQPPELFWKRSTIHQLTDSCLDIRVLDPAMGSGHFLVEVVDFVSNRLINFLNGWSENPVWALLSNTRDDILQEMEHQRVTIDVDKLTRVALLKRAVLKRCVYGVDLNLMAVELAKVSLWLDAFTLGAPLSFLNHHLRHGNSLIGALDLSESIIPGTERWNSLARAASQIVNIAKLTDSTPGEVLTSSKVYQSAREELRPTIQRLNVNLATHFADLGNVGQSQQYAYLSDDSKSLQPKITRDKFNTAQDIAFRKCFFHWKLEFPEVFVDERYADWRTDGGFDAVVGNPPYDVIKRVKGDETHNREVDFYRNASNYAPAMGIVLNLFRLFIVRVLELTKDNSHFGQIIPLSFTADASASKVRKAMINNNEILLLECFPQKDDPNNRVFIDAKLSTMILQAKKGGNSGIIECRVHPGKHIVLESPIMKIDVSSIERFDPTYLTIPIAKHHDIRILERIYTEEIYTPMSDVALVRVGEIDMTLDADCRTDTPSPTTASLLKGAQIHRYSIHEKPKQGDIEWVDVPVYNKKYGRSEKANVAKTSRISFQGVTGTDDSRRITATKVPSDVYLANSVNYLVPKDNRIAPNFLLAVLGSQLLEWRFRLTSTNNNVNNYEVEALPFRRLQFTTTAEYRQKSLTVLQQIYWKGLWDVIIPAANNHVTAGELGVIHDLLAFLAGQMLIINEKVVEACNEFLEWLEVLLQIRSQQSKTGIEALTGYTIIRNYIGNYQKGESELSWEDFFYRLHNNRNRFSVNLAQVKPQIQQAYEESLEALLPIKQQLAATDTLIDQIVYKLYGLTEKEIELIERPAYEQALTKAKDKALQVKKLRKSPEAAADIIAQTVLPAAKRLQSRVPLRIERKQLDQDLPGWHLFAGDVPTFLLTGEYNIQNLPDHLDFSTSIIGYAKAVEQAIIQRIFKPFRDAGYNASDCSNKVLQGFVKGVRKLTLGNFLYIFTSKEKALQVIAEKQYPGKSHAIFFEKNGGVRALLNDNTNIDLRNRAVHEELLTRDDAKSARAWALDILSYL